MSQIKGKDRKHTFKRKDDCYTRKLKTKRLVDYLRRELHDSTTHGLPYTVNLEIHWIERFFWAISFIFANGIIYVLLSSQYTRFMKTANESNHAFIANVWILLTERLGFLDTLTKITLNQAPIVTSVEKDYFNWNVSYPAIILCPKNKVDEDTLSNLVNESMITIGKDIEQYLRTITSVSMDTLHELRVPNEDMVSLLDPKNYASICTKLFKEFDNTSLTTVTKWPITVEKSMTEMGMCHVINSNIAGFDNPSKWTNTEIVYERNNIELSFHDRDFFVQIMSYADEYKIYTSSPDDVILSGAPSITFDTEGFLSFGVHISTTKASSDMRSMPLSLRKCRFLDEPDSGRYAIYSYNRCLIECRIKMILRLCGCIPHLYKPLENEKICNLAQLKCILLYNREIMTLSASNETLQKFDDISNIPRTSRDCGCLGDCEIDVYQNDNAIFLPQESLNRLRISVATFPKVKFVKQIIFSFYDLFLRGGGVVNLCIGTSVISIMELLLILLRIPIYEIVRSIQKCQNFATSVTTAAQKIPPNRKVKTK